MQKTEDELLFSNVTSISGTTISEIALCIVQAISGYLIQVFTTAIAVNMQLSLSSFGMLVHQI